MGKGVPNEPRAPPPTPVQRRLRYRVCRTDPPTEFDFFSHFRRGIRLRQPTPRAIDLSKGVSLWETEEQARALALRFPHTGHYVAAVAVPDRVRQEGHPTSGHWNVWAEPEEMLTWVVQVVPVG